MKVLKFGGTSIGTPERMQAVAKLIGKEKQIVVLSALSKTTNTLEQIAQSCKNNGQVNSEQLSPTSISGQAVNSYQLSIINELEAKYVSFVDKLFTTSPYRSKGKAIIKEHFSLLKNIEQSTREIFTSKEEKIILAQGELISTKLFYEYLLEQGMSPVLLPALNFMRIDENEEPIIDKIKELLTRELKKYPDESLFLTQGYICKNHNDEIDNLKRGGSDYTASLIGAVLLCEEIQIWTDIDGMHNNDPRIVKNTFPIEELSFDEAAELAYFGAKILHPSSVRPAKKFNIPVRILNTLQPKARGTLITADAKTIGIKAIAAKDNIIAIKIKSSRMLLAYGFLRKVFEIFERYKTPIDIITTSEIAISLTIDNPKHIKSLEKELLKLGVATATPVHVEIDYDQTIICVVGNFITEQRGVVLKVIQPLKNIPIRMISYGGSKYNVSLLIDTVYKSEALNALNESIFMSEPQMKQITQIKQIT